MICMRCINCSYNNLAKGIRLLDEIYRKKINTSSSVSVSAIETTLKYSYKNSWDYQGLKFFYTSYSICFDDHLMGLHCQINGILREKVQHDLKV